ncbi:two-component regulator propeller domain-containing protein [Pseudoflavitalea rhizosphaerae]|uniref:type IX secretion system anionic LPS delivery protein PorZ n=1 Tax=Pseudoflavitalea rhizosphaerae TaxID=1884793 RepID=UPI0013DEBE29|nr:two-component regulator propeller domain-containing protein [Pseudoflavitalea rhizosphaerae]
MLPLFVLLHAISSAQLQPVGQWRDHLPYHQAIAVSQQQSIIWCATPFSIFSVDPSDNSIERFSRISGLSETGIGAIGADPDGNKLVIAYSNSNVDVLLQNTVHNIDAIKNSTISGNKTINHIYVQQQRALLSTGLGIILLNLDKYEVSDTWIIGSNGNKTAVYNTVADAQFYYAATEDGLKRAPVNANNLADYRNWEMLSGMDGLPAGSARSVVLSGDQIFVQWNNQIFTRQNTSWISFYNDGWEIRELRTSGNRLLLTQQNGPQSRVISITNAGVVESIIQHPVFTAAPRQAIWFQQQYWIADAGSGLSATDGAGNFESFVPGSPAAVANGQMQVLDNTLWVAAGSVTPNWEPANNRNGLYRFRDNNWTNMNTATASLPDSINDIVSVAIDPTDQSIWAGSFDDGLLHIQEGKPLTVFKQNSAIQPAYFSTNSYRVSGLQFDAGGNLWISNYGSPGELVVRKPDGNFKSFTIPFPVSENAVAQLIADDYNQVWMVSPKGNGLYVFSYGNSIDNPSDDQWKWYRSGAGNGNLPDNNVNCIAKDQSGFIWIGTNRGIGIVQCPQDANSNTGCEAILPVVQSDNFAGYLFRDEQVQCIAVDGADRKWIGTKNGVWLISADGGKTLYRFHTGNSPLVDNDVQQIAANGLTGEIFFSTPKGICSFRSTATEGGPTSQNLLVFPNPVPPGYNGTIAIRGLANNAIVKITETDGRLVYQTRALGGQAVWNGRHYNGSKVSSGIYLVLVTDENKKEQTAAKIVFIK